MYLKILLFCLLYQSFNVLPISNQVECGLTLREWENKLFGDGIPKRELVLYINKIILKYLRPPVR